MYDKVRYNYEKELYMTLELTRQVMLLLKELNHLANNIGLARLDR